jgi:hypothetical protein
MRSIYEMDLDEMIIKSNYYLMTQGKVLRITAYFFLIYNLLQFMRWLCNDFIISFEKKPPQIIDLRGLRTA